MEFSVWVYPVSGTQAMELVFNWDRGQQGNAVGGIAIGVSADGTATLSVPGQQASANLLFGTWHRLQVVTSASMTIVRFFVDDAQVGVEAPVKAAAIVPTNATSGTVILGHTGGGVAAETDDYYYDDVELCTGIAPAGVAATCPPFGIAGGPDGNMWFTCFDADYSHSEIGKITPSGDVTFYALASGSEPYDIVAGPDGNLWFTEVNANKVGNITPSGTITEYSLPLEGNSGPDGITVGPDKNLWFSQAYSDTVGTITTAGVMTEHPIGTRGVHAESIARGSDGNLWFPEEGGNLVGRMTTSDVVTQFSTTKGSNPNRITSGPDGNLWFTQSDNNHVAKITPAGVLTEYPAPTAGAHSAGITPGPDGNLWFIEGAPGNSLVRMTTSGSVTEFPIPTPSSGPAFIAPGPDGALWFTEYFANKVGKVTTSGSFTEYNLPPNPAALSGHPGVEIQGQAIDGSTNEQTTYIVATFTDTDPADAEPQYSATIDWGDGHTTPGIVYDMDNPNPDNPRKGPNPAPGTPTHFAISGDHTYGKAQTYSVVATLTNKPWANGDSLSVTSAATIRSGRLCGQPQTASSGEPQVVVVLVDGIGSQEAQDGSFYPIPVESPDQGVPMITNYCPVDPNGNEHAWPAGLNLSLRKWSGFWVPRNGTDDPGGTSQICTATTTFYPNDEGQKDGPPGDGSTRAVIGGPLVNGRKDNCLVAQLADAAAVILPYSYTGALLQNTPSGPRFTFSGYTAEDSKQAFIDSIVALDAELSSIQDTWPTSHTVIVGHSNGGLTSELWWECNHGHCSDGLFDGVNKNCRNLVGAYDSATCAAERQLLESTGNARNVTHLFTLDSPLNGVEHCQLAADVVDPRHLTSGTPGSQAVSDTWCWLWDHRLERMPRIASMAADGSYAAIGTLGDPTYGSIPSGGGGGLQAQLVHDSDCIRANSSRTEDSDIINDDGLFGFTGCVVFPSVVSPCNGDTDLYGATAHHMVKACTPNISRIIQSVMAARSD